MLKVSASTVTPDHLMMSSLLKPVQKTKHISSKGNQKGIVLCFSINRKINYGQTFLAHLSTTCSRGAFRITWCPSSVVRLTSCVVNNFSKHLLPDRWANLDQTWQECSLGGPLYKFFTQFYSIKNSGCHGNK